MLTKDPVVTNCPISGLLKEEFKTALFSFLFPQENKNKEIIKSVKKCFLHMIKIDGGFKAKLMIDV